MSAIKAHAAEDRLLDAGELLLRVRAAIARQPRAGAAAAAARALEAEEARPGLSFSELRRRHADVKETLRLLKDRAS